MASTTTAVWQTDRVRALRKHIPLIVLLSCVSLYYVFIASAGTFETLEWHTAYYDLLARGFRSGHLYIPIAPKAALAAAVNPLGHKYRHLWLWDASLYHGRYYVYWGPVPALCVLAFKLLTLHSGVIYDQWLVVVFMIGRLLAGAALIVGVAECLRQPPPAWAVNLAVATFGLASPTPYFLARPVIYEAAIASGQCFLFCGLWAALQGMRWPARGTRWFLIAGTCFALAFGSRASLTFSVPLLVLITALLAYRRFGYPPARTARALVALGAPAACGLLLLGLYNYARFDDIREFGLRYQLTSRPFDMQAQYVVPNVVSYLASDLDWSCRFPYVRLPRHPEPSQIISWPEDYDLGDRHNGERAVGILVASWICWLLPLWPLRAGTGLARRLRQRSVGPWLTLPHLELWLAACSVACVISLGPALFMWMANMRFLEDAAGGLIIASLLAGFWLLGCARQVRVTALRRLARAAFVTLALETCLVGALLGFTGYMNNFQQHNPQLFHVLQKRVSLCDSPER